MRNFKLLWKNYSAIILTGLIVVFFMGCNEPIIEDPLPPDSNSTESFVPWYDVLEQVNLDDEIVFVQEGESIQQAVNAAEPGSSIYIEPDVYKEGLNIDKSDIRLIGLKGELLESVILENSGAGEISITGENVMIENVQLKGFDKTLPDNSELKSSSRRRNRIHLQDWSREDLGGGIAHYLFEVAMGLGEYDMVRIHRVVRESRPYRPIPTKGNIFMVHGAIQDFDDIFLTAGAEAINAKTSSPFYLASKNIDVWGIDMGWTMVPLETEDFSFMEGWGVEKDVDHCLKAMSIARLIRGLTRQGFGRMNLLGYSYGVDVVYGAASRETQQHWICRDVKGLITVDRAIKTDDLNAQKIACEDAGISKGKLDGGQFHDPWGVDLLTWGDLALNDPDGNSIFYPGFSNSEFLMWVGSQGFFTGNKDEFFYTDPIRFFRLSANLVPYWPMQIRYELSAVQCPDEEVTYDDYLGEISLPILYIGAEKAEGEAGIYTSSLTSSSDITSNIVPGYSHADLWFAYDADKMVWSVLHDWLIDHSKKRRRGW